MWLNWHTICILNSNMFVRTHCANLYALTWMVWWNWYTLVRYPLQWRHNDHDNVLNHQPDGCLLNRLFRRKPKKTSKLHVTGLCVGNSPGPVNSPHKGPVTRKMFPFDDVIMHVTRNTPSRTVYLISPCPLVITCSFYYVILLIKHTPICEGKHGKRCVEKLC